MPGYAAALAALSDRELEALLGRRPDLRAGRVPGSFGELASRAGAAASIQAALGTLDAGTLQLAELLALIGLPTSVEAVLVWAGPGLDEHGLDERLGRLAELGLALAGRDGTIAGPHGLAHAFERPGGLGPAVAELSRIGVSRQQLATVAANLGVTAPETKAELVKAVSAALAEPALVAGVLAGAGEGARRLLARARAADGPLNMDATMPGRPETAQATWLLERGLLLPVTYGQVVVPREAELAMRGGLVFPDWPRPPRLPAPVALPAADLAAAAAQRIVLAAESLLTRLDAQPLKLIQSGTLGVRDLRRLAGALDLAEDEAGLLVDLAVAAGLLVVGGPWGSRSLGLTPAADAWLAATRAERWAALAAAWGRAVVPLEEHLLERNGVVPAGEPARPLVLAQQPAMAERRRALLELLASLPAGHGVDAGALGAQLTWSRPLLWRRAGPGRELVVRDAAVLLGLVAAFEGRVGPGLALDAWLAGAEPGALAAAAGHVLPDGGRSFLVAGDLTVVAPGGLAPDLAARLAGMAEPVASGGATTWRIDQPSLRRALDTGSTADELLEFLGAHSSTPLPQALTYLVREAERQHGRLRIGGASTYLRGEAALVTELVRSAAGRRLGLRELAPGVAVSGASQRELLAGLRDAGHAPVAEGPDGSARVEASRPVRHPARSAGGRVLRPAEPGPAPAAAELVARLRTTAVAVTAAAANGNGPVHAAALVAALCERAVAEQLVVEIGYDGEAGETVRAVEPFEVADGRMRAWCHLREDERTFLLERIAWARLAEPAGG